MPTEITPEDRARLKAHPPLVIWLTGLSGAGKTTIAKIVERELHRDGYHTYLLDGDVLRQGLNRDLGFSERDRRENIRRATEIARMMYDAGLIVITALISPLRDDRQAARLRFPTTGFMEVYVDTPLALAEARDPKGLYSLARLGKIRDFTGIDSPYEAPLDPEITVWTENADPEYCAGLIIKKLAVKHREDL